MADKRNLLIVDDELSVRDSLRRWFAAEGCEVGIADSPAQALDRLAERRWDVALLDLDMPGAAAIALQQRLQELDPDLLVIMMTGHASLQAAVAALELGACGCVTKPLDPGDVSRLLRNAVAQRRAAPENARLREVASASQPAGLIGQGPAMRKVFEAIEDLGPADAAVLVTGESGTGKELVARALHAAGPRRFHPFVALHCGALTETLLESELFGHEKGAFTGAQFRKKGLFEVAQGGTVFLGEIAALSLETQSGLLRVLQEKHVTRVGGSQPIQVDFRCVAATNRRLEDLVDDGRFRPDLYSRLHVFRIDLPPLRERRDDIPLLAGHFMNNFAFAMNKRIARIAPAAMRLLQQHDWVGNVRELENAVERAMIVAREPELSASDFLLQPQQRPGAAEARTLDEVERAHILRVVQECGGNQTHAAEALGIDRVTLHNKLKRYGWVRAAALPHKTAAK